MEHKTLLCFGDSNTYGFDPRMPFGGRYEEEDRWCDLLAAQTGWTVVNCGENGRTIPLHNWSRQVLVEELNRHAPVDLLLVMLGTNDILMGYEADLDVVAGHMRDLLDTVRSAFPALPILLLSPPHTTISMPELSQRLEGLSRRYGAMAEDMGLLFCDAQSWPLPMACDGVHLSQEGHHMFFRGLSRFLDSQPPKAV